jgi:hypothetical protein
VLGNFNGKRRPLPKTAARQGGELAETRRANVALGGGVQQLEEVNRRLGESSEELNGQLAQGEAGRQNARVCLQEAIAAGKAKEDLEKIEQDAAKLKEDTT